MSDVSTWDYKDKHIDSNITSVNFVNSSRCIVYAAPWTGEMDDKEPSTLTAVGLVQGYNWSEQRQIEMIFELGSEVPYLVPGRTTGQISLSRILLYGADLTNALYGKDLDKNPEQWIKSLKDIVIPLNLLFVMYGPDQQSQSGGVKYSRLFTGCWISARNESIAAGQTLVAESCNILYQNVADTKLTMR